jgi:excisionase family DNA binding protein
MKLAFNKRKAAQALGISKSKIEKMIAVGELKATKIGVKVIIPTAELHRLISINPPVTTPEWVTGSSLAKLPVTKFPQGVFRMKQTRKVLAVALPPDLLERLRNAVYWTPGLSIRSFIEQVLTRALDELERQAGKPFPPRNGALKKGQPL